MKRRLMTTAMLVACAAPFVRADTTTTTGSAPTIADIVAREVARWTIALTLTSDQQAKATTIFTTEETALAALQTQETTAQTALATAIKANSTTGIATAAKTLGDLHAQEVLAHATADAAFYALLTADQKTKYDTYQTAGMGGGPRGGGGPH